MASKLKIDVKSTTPGSSRPGSSLSQASGMSGGEFESFKGSGQSLSGRKTKGKGKSARKIEEVDPYSKIQRTEYVFSSFSVRPPALNVDGVQ